MPCRWPSLLAATALLCLAFAPDPARAQACALPDYVGEADGRLSGGAACVELDRFDIDTPDGRKRVRIIRDERMPASFTEPVPLVRQGIERAAAAHRSIGAGRIDGELIVLLSGLQPVEDPAGGEDSPWVHGRADSHYVGECLIVMYPANVAAEELAFSTAHEYFHCIQYATAVEQMTASLAGQPNQWWVEGTAEWFANLAIPGTAHSAGHVAGFDARSPETPITGLAYQNVVLFSWYGAQYGAAAVVGMMAGMPTGGGRNAEDDAAEGLMDEDAWLAFAEAYMDGAIRYPGGGALPSSPRRGERTLWTESEVQTLTAERLVLHRGLLIFTCGDWQIRPEDEKGRWEVSETPGAWMPLPPDLQVEPEQEKRFRLAAMGTGDDGFSVTIDAEQRDDEQKCLCSKRSDLLADGRDACLVGDWKLISGGANQWLEQQIKEIERASGTWESYDSEATTEDASGRGGSVLSIREDGRYLYENNRNQTRVRAQHRQGLFGSLLRGQSSGSGLWGSKDDEIYICPTGKSSSARATIQLPNAEPWQMELPGNLPDHLMGGAYSYRCSDAELYLRFTLMSFGSQPLEWRYRRED